MDSRCGVARAGVRHTHAPPNSRASRGRGDKDREVRLQMMLASSIPSFSFLYSPMVPHSAVVWFDGMQN
jgi:hypothetical protein